MNNKEIEKLKHERDEYLDGWKRSKADFLNYKKEEGERLQEMAEYVKGGLLVKILPILDNLVRAEKEIPEKEKGNKVYKGFLYIVGQWRGFLKSQGIEEVQTIGKPFNPEVHEAVGEVEGKEVGFVAEEVEKGYTMNGKLLRAAKVKVIK